MESFPKDVLFTLALELDLPSLLKWCQSNSRINEKVCNNPDVWKSKVLRDYPDYQKFNLDKSFKEIYNFMYQLFMIKKLLNTTENLYDIYLRKNINLSRRNLTNVPEFNLPHLIDLDLSYNKLETVPLLNLPNLRNLWLHNNMLINIPKFNLPNLQILSLNRNTLTTVPSFNLPKLDILYLNDNSLRYTGV